MKNFILFSLVFFTHITLADRKVRVAFMTNAGFCDSTCVQECEISHPQAPGNTIPLHIKVTPYLTNAWVNYNTVEKTKTIGPIKEYDLAPGENINLVYWNRGTPGAIKALEITVVGDKGFLQGDCMSYAYGTSSGYLANPASLNGGRPF